MFPGGPADAQQKHAWSVNGPCADGASERPHEAAVVLLVCSFDIMRDGQGGPRRAFPHDMLVAAGTQAARASANYIALMRLSNLGQVSWIARHSAMSTQIRSVAWGLCQLCWQLRHDELFQQTLLADQSFQKACARQY